MLPPYSIIFVTVYLIIAMELEWFGWTTFVILTNIAAIQFFHIYNLFSFVKENVLETVLFTSIYIGIGVVWSFIKWFFFLISERDKSRKWLEAELIKMTYNPYHNPLKINVPLASNNKGRIIAWVSYWPFSLIGTILNDPFRKLINLIFNYFKNLYQRIANKIYKKDVESLNAIMEVEKINRDKIKSS